ncbi:DUF4830 domain-containing protein [Ethanoligenens harbinense]|uniref:DUF4830 domain-containing protein n=1 Tax=Ethanoligenens harbinense (strain DSM 18485 / JCM 12961 / CGMCC 1.5033 / YUAN-3) TaxID=663278 RepID=E6U6L4_ETHHY|nr:DUF4830 domain-containing protein [Ethanoligenens harbinense]ADU25747.1 hypothetical protein Ethha_0160 [Ethanoligenens harbinense YUAN-3]
MLVASVKVSALRAAVVVFALAVLAGAALWPSRGVVTVWSGQSYRGVSDNAKRVAFLEKFGWTVDPTPTEVVEVVIPQTFDQVYRNYNKLQKKQGLDLTPYKGARVKRWTYRVTNYPNYDGEVFADLLIQNNDTVVAGDVRTVAVSGFIQGLARPNPQTGVPTLSPAAADITAGMFPNRAV